MFQRIPEQREVAEPTTIYDSVAFPVLTDRPYVIVNFVSSADGKTQLKGTARGIGSAVDHGILVRLRAYADAVLLGAATVRSDRPYMRLPHHFEAFRNSRGLAAQPQWVVATSSGNVPADAAVFQHVGELPIVLAPEGAPAQLVRDRLGARAQVLEMAGSPPNLARAFHVLRHKHNTKLLVCEGGANLFHSLVTARLVDELFLTFAPKLLGGEGKSLLDGPLLRDSGMPLTLLSLFEHDSELFLRYRLQ